MALDRDSPFLEISPLAAWRSNFNVGSGFVVGIGVIEGVECVILGHDPSVRAGAFNPFNSKKLMRGLEIARTNRMPYVQFVESAGADLRGEAGGGDPEAAIRREVGHFAESGRLFYEITELSKLRIPTVSIVFGASTAGGAYQPGMSDYNIFIRGQSKVFLGGPPLVKMATGEDATKKASAAPRCIRTVSGLGDYLAEDEMRRHPHRAARSIAHLNWRKLGPGRRCPPTRRSHDPEDLLGIVAKDLRQPFDMREVIARIVDGSRFEEFKPLYGPTLVTGWASIHGFPVGILGNNGALLSESSEKAAQFIQLCNQIDVPLLFLHNITGYIVGTDFEQGGITKDGSKMINAVANSTVPHITVIVGASYGAGNYGMSGRAYGTRFTFTWPTAKIAVMGPKQMAGVMTIVRRGRAERRGETFDEDADAKRVAVGSTGPRNARRVVRHLARLRRRHDRPARHPHRARIVAVGLPQQRGRRHQGIRHMADVNPDSPSADSSQSRRDRPAHHAHGARHGDRDRRRLCGRRRDAPFVREADVAIALGGRTGAETLPRHRQADRRCRARARMPCIPATAFSRRTPRLRDAVIDAGLTWVGPSPEVDRAIGDKLRRSGCCRRPACRLLDAFELTADADATGAAAKIGYPVLIKAAAGGGGRGMRIVETQDPSCADAVASAAARPASFGDGTVFLERWLTALAPRRDADSRGQARQLVHLFERECSIQRRHQKIIEEAPSPRGR